jgi:cytidylate kinase
MQTTEFSTRVPQTIAIDGPAASGKTTVGAELAID